MNTTAIIPTQAEIVPQETAIQLSSPSVVNKLTDGQVITMWLNEKGVKTQETYTATLKQFFTVIPQPLAEITAGDLQEWRSHCQAQYKTTTSNKKLATIKSLLSFAQAIGHLELNTGRIVKSLKVRDELQQKILPEGDIKKLIGAAKSERDRLLLKTLYLTGMRVSELCDVQWPHITPYGNDFLLSIHGKGGKNRVVKMPKSLYNELQSIRSDKTEYIFFSRSKKRLDRQAIHILIKDCAERAGVSDAVSAHFFRHAHASHSLSNGASLKSVQTQLGHSSIAVTSVYLHDDESSSDFISI